MKTVKRLCLFSADWIHHNRTLNHISLTIFLSFPVKLSDNSEVGSKRLFLFMKLLLLCCRLSLPLLLKHKSFYSCSQSHLDSFPWLRPLVDAPAVCIYLPVHSQNYKSAPEWQLYFMTLFRSLVLKWAFWKCLVWIFTWRCVCLCVNATVTLSTLLGTLPSPWTELHSALRMARVFTAWTPLVVRNVPRDTFMLRLYGESPRHEAFMLFFSCSEGWCER